MRSLNALFIAAMLLSGSAYADKTPAPTSDYAPTAILTKQFRPSGCIDGIGTQYTFKGKLVGSFSAKTVDVPAEGFLFLWLQKPIAVCGYYFAHYKQMAYENVKRIGILIVSPNTYRAIIKLWGNSEILIDGSLFNTGFTGHGGGPIIFGSIKRFCYSKATGEVFHCVAWSKRETFDDIVDSMLKNGGKKK